MKRPGQPKRKAELKRGKPPERGKPPQRKTALKAGVTKDRRKPLRSKPLSDDERERRRQVRAEVFKRDGWKCQLAPLAKDRCIGILTFGHRRKSGQGGKYTVENGSTQCAHHNDELEANADLARRAHQAGIVIRSCCAAWDRCGLDDTL